MYGAKVALCEAHAELHDLSSLIKRLRKLGMTLGFVL